MYISTTCIELFNAGIGRQYIEYWVFKMQLHNISTIQSNVYIIKEKYEVFISSYSSPTTKTILQCFRYTLVGTSNGYATNGGFYLWHSAVSCLSCQCQQSTLATRLSQRICRKEHVRQEQGPADTHTVCRQKQNWLHQYQDITHKQWQWH